MVFLLDAWRESGDNNEDCRNLQSGVTVRQL
jgi:hypothetical protein